MPDLITLDTFKALADLPLPDDVHTWTWEQAARHSLRKWELISELRDTEQLGLEAYRQIRSRYIWADYCALCERSRDEETKIDCSVCPLEQCGYGCNSAASPWEHAVRHHSYRPMVHALRKAVVQAQLLDCPGLAATTPSVTELLTKEGAD